MPKLSEQLYVVKIESGKAVAWTVEELLAFLNIFATTWEDADTDYVCQNIYFETEVEALAKLAELQQFFSEQGPIWGLDDTVKLSMDPIKKEDWSEVWKRFFHPKKISDRLVIKPSWESYEAKGDESILELDPGMSFGTGQHGTTQACLQFIDELTCKEQFDNMLDAGTGSGILSLGASKLGIKNIVAFDYDPDAVRIAGENLAATGVSDNVKLSVADVAEWSTDVKYDLVIANILCVVLKANADVLANCVKDNGYLILAGILEKQYDDLRDTFIALGYQELKNTQIKEWKSGLFRKA